MTTDEAIEVLGGLVAQAGGEGDGALDAVKDALALPGPLMGSFEAARELGVKSPNLRKVAGLPEPVQELKAGPVWRASDIRTLARRRRRTNEEK